VLATHPLGGSGPARILNEGYRWTGEAVTQTGAPPTLGEHTDEILKELATGARTRAASASA
jgi:crotonobetainyl-CoA:carnitine CoA-transferase CaiB-like acyl-CoA transferase